MARSEEIKVKVEAFNEVKRRLAADDKAPSEGDDAKLARLLTSLRTEKAQIDQ